MKYEHINDCWEELRECKSVEEMEEAADNFPRWSGHWIFEQISDNEIEVTNCWYDKNIGEEDFEREIIEV